MKFKLVHLNYVCRELERKPGEVENLRILTEFLEQEGILGSLDVHRMVEVPEYIQKIVEVPEMLQGNQD